MALIWQWKLQILSASKAKEKLFSISSETPGDLKVSYQYKKYENQ